jgi:hypothetical protein
MFHHITEIFPLANFDAFAFISVELPYTCRIGSAFFDIDQAGFAVESDRFVQKS